MVDRRVRSNGISEKMLIGSFLLRVLIKVYLLLLGV